MGLLGMKWDQDMDAASFGMKALQGRRDGGSQAFAKPQPGSAELALDSC